jgi:hypothetical protein
MQNINANANNMLALTTFNNFMLRNNVAEQQIIEQTELYKLFAFNANICYNSTTKSTCAYVFVMLQFNVNIHNINIMDSICVIALQTLNAHYNNMFDNYETDVQLMYCNTNCVYAQVFIE